MSATTLRLPARVAQRVHAHLLGAYPEEGCGVLLGRELGASREVVLAIPSENQSADSRANRYVIAPEQVLSAEREGRVLGLDVIGFFHSHPDHPPRPSAFDLEHAWPYYSYLIVSLERGRVAETRSWRMVEERTRFEPETVEILPVGDSREASGEQRT